MLKSAYLPAGSGRSPALDSAAQFVDCSGCIQALDRVGVLYWRSRDPDFKLPKVVHASYADESQHKLGLNQA